MLNTLNIKEEEVVDMFLENLLTDKVLFNGLKNKEIAKRLNQS